MSSTSSTFFPSQLTIKPSLLRPQIPSISAFQFRSSSPQPLNLKNVHNFLSFSRKIEDPPGFLYSRNLGFCGNAESGEGNGESSDGDDGVDDAEKLARSDSSMPERFRYLTKEVPEAPFRWPWFLALPLLIYTWRAVLFELSNWQKLPMSILCFVGELLKFAVAIVFTFIGDPITFMARFIGTVFYTIQSYYSGIVAYAPVGELSVLIMFACAVIAIAEATVRESVHNQPYVLSGLIGYATVRGYISGPLFWTLLLGLYSFSKLVRKRDDVSAAMPVAALLAAIGEPWVRVVVISSYLALAISQHSKQLPKGDGEVKAVATKKRLPLPLLGAALAIGIHLAAKWAGNRHLTWMVV